MEEEAIRPPEGEVVSVEAVDRLRDLIAGTRVAMLTTVEDGGRLRSRPMAVQEISDNGEAWLFTNQDSAKVEDVERRHAVNLTWVRALRGMFVTASGVAEVSRERRKIRRLWRPSMQVWYPNGVDSPEICLLRVCLERVDWWDAPLGGLVDLSRRLTLALGGTGRPVQGLDRNSVLIRPSAVADRGPVMATPSAGPETGMPPGTPGGGPTR